MTATEILRAARQYMAERGLARGAFMDREGRVCAVGALRLAVHRGRPGLGVAGLPPLEWEAYTDARRRLDKCTPWEDVVAANDGARDKYEVLSIFDCALEG
jgi:hypothetical protein